MWTDRSQMCGSCNVMLAEAERMACHQQPLLRFRQRLVRVIYGALIVVYMRVFVCVHVRAFRGSPSPADLPVPTLVMASRRGER